MSRECTHKWVFIGEYLNSATITTTKGRTHTTYSPNYTEGDIIVETSKGYSIRVYECELCKECKQFKIEGTVPK